MILIIISLKLCWRGAWYNIYLWYHTHPFTMSGLYSLGKEQMTLCRNQAGVEKGNDRHNQ